MILTKMRVRVCSLLLAFSLFFASGAVQALTVSIPLQGVSEEGSLPSPKQYGKQFIAGMKHGPKRVLSVDNLPLALAGIGLTGLSLSADDRVKSYFKERKPLRATASDSTIGAGGVPAGLGAVLWGTGKLINNKKLADTGLVEMESILTTAVATELLKYAVGRTRPDNSDHRSFPSGHAALGAAMAASISEMYDWDLKISLPLYSVAAYSGVSRLQDNRHFLSDVVGGVALGTIIGISFAKGHRETFGDQTENPGKVSIVPLFDEEIKGMMFSWKFR